MTSVAKEATLRWVSEDASWHFFVLSSKSRLSSSPASLPLPLLLLLFKHLCYQINSFEITRVFLSNCQAGTIPSIPVNLVQRTA